MVLIRGESTNKFADKYKIRSSRLPNWNYSNPGIYFVTICTYRHNNFFGKIVAGKMKLSNQGKIVLNCLIDVPTHFPNVSLDEFVIMPNHVHLILKIFKPSSGSVETHHDASLPQQHASLPQQHASLPIKYKQLYFHQIAIKSSQTIPLIIKQFKSAATRLIDKRKSFFAWQTRYYDQIIKSETELKMIKNYIINNPKNWSRDKLHKNNKLL